MFAPKCWLLPQRNAVDNTQGAVDIVEHTGTNVGGKVPAEDQGHIETL